MDSNEYWQAIQNRDHAYDGRFFFAVRSTGVYCRPSCPARRPRPEQVLFFVAADEAMQAGFRACRRCQPDRVTPAEPNLATVQQICRYLDEPHEQTPTLADLAARFSFSPYYLQRTFKRVTGVSPRQYAAAQRRAHLKAGLKDGQPVTTAVLTAGYQSASSVYGAARPLGMSPSLYQRGGQAQHIVYAVAPCALGWLLVAGTAQGVCAIKLGDDPAALEQDLGREFPSATIEPSARLQQWVSALQDHMNGAQPHLDLPLDVRATAFQQRVWQALRDIPYGETRSYSAVAQAIGQPAAARAVAQACAGNPVALAVPCHRVVRQDGALGGYRWGIERKRKLLRQETGK